jgi:hypothetical protein
MHEEVAMIRPAKLDDIPDLVGLGRMFHASTRLAGLAPYDKHCVADLLSGMIHSRKSVVLVMERDGVVVGGICGVIVPAYWNRFVLIGQQFAWFVHPDHRGKTSLKLLDGFERECMQRGARLISSGAKHDAHFEGMDAVLTRSGYFELESMYLKRVTGEG